MSMLRRLRAALGLGLVALAGTWLAHSLEYLRVGGVPGLRAALTGSVHGYMLPAAGIIALAGGLGGGLALRGWRALGRRLDSLSAALRVLLRAGPVAAAPGDLPGGPSRTARLVTLWLPLAALQCALFLVQENLEARRTGLPLPGLHALLGGHAFVLLFNLDIAFAGALLLLGLGRLLRRRVEAVRRAVRLVRALQARRLRPLTLPPPASADVVAALRWMAGPLWRRPPPAAALPS